MTDDGLRWPLAALPGSISGVRCALSNHVMRTLFKAAARPAGSCELGGAVPRSQPARPPGPPYTRVALCVCVPLHPLAMVDAFLGTWKLVDTANFDEYMKALGEWGGLRGGGGLESRHHPLFFLPPPSSPNLPGQAPCTRGSGWGRLQAVGGSLLPGQGGLWGALGLYAWGLGWGKGALVLPLPPSRVQPSAREWMPPPGCREPPRTLSASPPTPAPELPITQPQLLPCF